MRSKEYLVTPDVALAVYFCRQSRVWYGYYVDTMNAGGQIGDAWHAATKEEVLIHRPEVPVATEELV